MQLLVATNTAPAAAAISGGAALVGSAAMDADELPGDPPTADEVTGTVATNAVFGNGFEEADPPWSASGE